MGPSVLPVVPPNVAAAAAAQGSFNIHETLGALFLCAFYQILHPTRFADPSKQMYSSLCESCNLPSAFTYLRPPGLTARQIVRNHDCPDLHLLSPMCRRQPVDEEHGGSHLLFRGGQLHEPGHTGLFPVVSLARHGRVTG